MEMSCAHRPHHIVGGRQHLLFIFRRHSFLSLFFLVYLSICEMKFLCRYFHENIRRRKASIVSKRMVMTNEKIFSFLRKRNKKVECLRYIFPRPENSSNFASTWFLFNSVTNRSIVFFFIILKIKFFFILVRGIVPNEFSNSPQKIQFNLNLIRNNAIKVAYYKPLLDIKRLLVRASSR